MAVSTLARPLNQGAVASTKSLLIREQGKKSGQSRDQENFSVLLAE
jgi:hypothetical protein